MKVTGFDWDDGNTEKCQKHGLTLSEIEEVFTHSPDVRVNHRHTSTEERLQAIGKTSEGRSVFVVFTLRQKVHGLYIRPVSARYMHQKEIDYYEASEEKK